MRKRRISRRPTLLPSTSPEETAGSKPRVVTTRKFIDPSLARGLARSIGTFNAPGETHAMHRVFQTRVFPRWRRMTSAREARRFLQRVVVPVIKPFALHTAVIETVDGPTLLAEYYEVTEARCLVFCWAWYAPLSPGGHDVTEQSVIFREHAIARCMQREGTDQLDDVFGIVQSAAAHWLQIYGVASDGGWKQAFLWCARGIFVGEMSAAAIQIATYISADQASGESRWLRVHRFLRETCDPIFEAIDRSPADAIDDREVTLVHLSRLNAIFIDLPKRFPFLLESYKPGTDMFASAWRLSPNNTSP